jgi:hypothetical protein
MYVHVMRYFERDASIKNYARDHVKYIHAMLEYLQIRGRVARVQRHRREVARVGRRREPLVELKGEEQVGHL